jgi:alpha-mannosidase
MGSPIDFFDDLCRRTDGGKKLPTWKGELYLELHRGVCHLVYAQPPQVRPDTHNSDLYLADWYQEG